MSSLNDDSTRSISLNEHEDNVLEVFKRIRKNNVNRLIIAHINYNTLNNKFESLKLLVKDNIDILVITETKLDDSCALPFRI